MLPAVQSAECPPSSCCSLLPDECTIINLVFQAKHCTFHVRGRSVFIWFLISQFCSSLPTPVTQQFLTAIRSTYMTNTTPSSLSPAQPSYEDGASWEQASYSGSQSFPSYATTTSNNHRQRTPSKYLPARPPPQDAVFNVTS